MSRPKQLFVCPEETQHPVLNPVLPPLSPASALSTLHLLSQLLCSRSAQPRCEMQNDTLGSLASVYISFASLSERQTLSGHGQWGEGETKSCTAGIKWPILLWFFFALDKRQRVSDWVNLFIVQNFDLN